MFSLKGKLISKEVKNYQAYGHEVGRMELVLEIPEGSSSMPIKFHVPSDRMPLLDVFEIGDRLDVDFKVKGKRNGNGEIWNRLEVYDVYEADEE